MMYVLLPHLHILNANAMSSTYTIGFPAMTAWMGAVHAMQRKLMQKENLQRVRLRQMAISSHECQLQAYKGPGDYHYSIIATANPLKKKGNTFERPPFIEEPRIHMEVSLLIQCEGIDGDNQEQCKQAISQMLPRMKIAGGDIISFGTPDILYASDNDPESEKKILYRLMPGYVLIERKDLAEKEMKNGKDGLDALLSYIAIEHTAEEGSQGMQWLSKKKESGWLVPIAVGFKGISELGKVENQRDQEKLHRFAESVVTLGEFKMPHRFTQIADILWHYEYDEENSLYLCKNGQ